MAQMSTVLVTGAAGFIGKNLVAALRQQPLELLTFDVADPAPALDAHLEKAELIYHLAGVNRPQTVEEFASGNTGFTEQIIRRLGKRGRAPAIVFASSIQAELDNPYGVSKRGAEEALAEYARQCGAPVLIYRLPNVFGKWCRPNYNSVVATFCHNIARGLDITISDPERVLDLIYVDDVVNTLATLTAGTAVSGVHYPKVEPVYQISVGRLAELIRGFAAMRSDLRVPDLSDRLVRCLHATYLSYLEPDNFAYPLQQRTDARGTLAELLKSPDFGQIFVSRTHPGVTRGNHYHHTKVEKFVVLEGEADHSFPPHSDRGTADLRGQRDGFQGCGHPARLYALDRKRREQRIDRAVLGERAVQSRRA